MKIINSNLKTFYEGIKNDLEKPEDDVFNNEVSNKYLVREARNHNKVHNLMNVLSQKLC